METENELVQFNLVYNEGSKRLHLIIKRGLCQQETHLSVALMITMLRINSA